MDSHKVVVFTVSGTVASLKSPVTELLPADDIGKSTQMWTGGDKLSSYDANYR